MCFGDLDLPTLSYVYPTHLTTVVTYVSDVNLTRPHISGTPEATPINLVHSNTVRVAMKIWFTPLQKDSQ